MSKGVWVRVPPVVPKWNSTQEAIRGSPAKGVDELHRARVQIPSVPPNRFGISGIKVIDQTPLTLLVEMRNESLDESNSLTTKTGVDCLYGDYVSSVG